MSTLSATITADTSQFNSAVTKAKGELEKLTSVSKKQRTEFDKAVRTIDRVRNGYVKGERATKALNSSVQKLTQLHAELKAANNPLADSILRVANAAAKEKANIDHASSSVKKLKTESGNLFKGVGDSFRDFSSLASAFNSGGLVSALGSLAGPLSVVTAGFAGLNEVIKNNETLFDEWQGVVSGAGTAWTNFMRTFNFSTIGASFTAGKKFYDASDALGSFRALNASMLGGILEDTQKAKTDKSEGRPWSKEQLDKLKGRVENYFGQERKMVQDTAKAKRKTLLAGLKGDELKLAEDFFTEFDKADNKYAFLEEYKRKYNQAAKQVREIEEKNSAYKTYKDPQTGMEYPVLDPVAVKNLEKNNKLYASAKAVMKSYGFLANSESDITEYVKLLTDEKRSSQEEQRLIKEINEAVSKETKNSIVKSIEDLHKENKELKEKIEDANKKLNDPNENSIVDLTELKAWQNKVIKNREELLKLYNTFESTPVKKYWELVTKYDNAMLYGGEELEYMQKAIRKDVEAYVKEMMDLGYTVGDLWEMIIESRKLSHRYDNAGENTTQNLWKYMKIAEIKISAGKSNEKNPEKEKDKKLINWWNKKINEVASTQLENLNQTTQAVNDLASAWSNLWEIIGVGNDKTKQTMQALGGAVTDATNMFKTLAENELAASQAVALGKATSSASGLPFPYNLIAMGTVAATVTSMFARFASIGKFAEGGIVGGNSTIGDYNLARVNSGEMILNGTQQKRLFNMLNGEGGLSDESSGGQKVELVVRGQDLVGVLHNYSKKINKVR